MINIIFNEMNHKAEIGLMSEKKRYLLYSRIANKELEKIFLDRP